MEKAYLICSKSQTAVNTYIIYDIFKIRSDKGYFYHRNNIYNIYKDPIEYGVRHTRGVYDSTIGKVDGPGLRLRPGHSVWE